MNNLFNDFEGVSSKQWKQKIQYDLKGADYNESLVWQSLEGINVAPTYHAEDFSEKFQPIVGNPNLWNIAQSIFIDDEIIVNNLAIDAIKRGAESIIFSASKVFDIKQVFKNFPFEKIPIYFDFKFLDEAFLLKLKSFLSSNKAEVFYNVDLLGNLAESGNWFENETKDYTKLHSILKDLNVEESPNLLSINASLFQNAGANMVQQLAYALAQANEYLNHLLQLHEKDSALFSEDFFTKCQLTFKISVGSNYFFEIAKIRALRKLYVALASEYNFNPACHIIATPSKRNKTIYDYNVNMLRTTSECMSAILGGANTICNLPYDSIYHKSNEFGERISRNQLLILKRESYFDVVGNSADGSYYIESITNQLAEKALSVFKEIEKGGGFLKQLQEGTIQKKIKESAEKEQDYFDEGKLKLLGTNYHINKNDKMHNDLQLFPFVKTNIRKTLISPIVEKRIAEKNEMERLELEK